MIKGIEEFKHRPKKNIKNKMISIRITQEQHQFLKENQLNASKIFEHTIKKIMKQQK